jgi:hypothetical protein
VWRYSTRWRRGLSALANASIATSNPLPRYQLAPPLSSTQLGPAQPAVGEDLEIQLSTPPSKALPEIRNSEDCTNSFSSFLRGLRAADSYQSCPRCSGLDPTSVRGTSVWGLAGSWGWALATPHHAEIEKFEMCRFAMRGDGGHGKREVHVSHLRFHL